ncbi:MAG: glycosyltransferase [Phycisphaerales bacterium]|nr:glycosyltransferase [Phycisphaerales bacterium]
MLLEVLAIGSLSCAALPLGMTCVNLVLFQAPKVRGRSIGARAEVSVCVPARNEAANIQACVQGILASEHAAVEVLMYDDQSQDETPAIIADMCQRDARCRSVATVTMEAGWNGKQWGCEQMGQASSAQWLLFTDADVRFSPQAVALGLQYAQDSNSDLVSTFPRQICASVGEAMVVPLIHFVLLGYLPMALMRSDARQSLGAGCGQYLLVKRDAWLRAGGHRAFKNSMHDGIQLPRAVRATGGRTDLFDATDFLSVRMYKGFAATWKGFTKNAFEGLGSMTTLLVFTTLHVLGHVVPAALLVAWLFGMQLSTVALGCLLAASLAGIVTRALLARRFHQPWIGVALHPVAMLLMTVIQWRSWWLSRTGRRAWRGRVSGV